MAGDRQKLPGHASPLHVRLFWFGALWLAGVGAVGAVSLIIKLALR